MNDFLDDPIIWMAGTEESVQKDAYTLGPSVSIGFLLKHMVEGDVLVCKNRITFETISRQQLINGELIPFIAPGLWTNPE